MAAHTLGWFNALPVDDAREQLRACNAAERFGREVAAGRPYASVTEAAAAAEAVSLALAWDEVGQALQAHPRIGDRADGDAAEARSSRSEQASMESADDAVRAALLAGNRAYEERFGHVYLIRAAGRSPAEMLDALQRRLRNDPDTERGEVTRQLAEITRLRVERLVGS